MATANDIFGLVETELKKRALASKWSPEQVNMIETICQWQLDHYDERPGYTGHEGLPNPAMTKLLDYVWATNVTVRYTSLDTLFTPAQITRWILSFWGPAHVLMCDVIPGYRPKLFCNPQPTKE